MMAGRRLLPELIRRRVLQQRRGMAARKDVDDFVLNLIKDVEAMKSTPPQLAAYVKDFVEKEVRASSTLEVGDNVARIDTRRASRNGFPEVIFGAGKTPAHIAQIMHDMHQKMDRKLAVIATKVDAEQHAAILAALGDGVVTYLPVPRIAYIPPEGGGSGGGGALSVRGTIAVLCAGTSDFAVAEEAAILLELSGVERVTRLYDVGVAGLHRLLNNLPKIEDADVIIVCAGMDGALPSVVSGLVKAPVVAVPTSVGYGAAFGGVSALLTMLNSCSPGISVVNIDNGFGAAVMAFKILKVGEKKQP